MERIQEPTISWNDQGHLRSDGFDDVYYNRKNGLEETRLVFLEANNLPANWLKKDNFTIAETGFGTGLNFLATWQLFEETATSGERLDFISVEKFPLHKDDLARSLHPWRGIVDPQKIDRLLAVYPPRFPGFHRRWISDRVTVTIIFDDVLRAFRQLESPVDAWFLDGFAPKKNAEMWQPEMYVEMARLSHSGTTLGSFTAVGDVRRGLAEAGFAIKRKKGFAYKYHRTIGAFSGTRLKPDIKKPEHVTIIGAGLAGAAAAWALQRRGINCTVLEKESDLGKGASGNRLGLINPKIEAQDNPRTDAGLSAFSFANHLLAEIPDIDYRQDGALHMGFKDEKQGKLQKLFDAGNWLSPHMQWFGNCLLYPDAASVNTSKLVPALLKHADVRFNQDITALPAGPAILAAGWGLHDFLPDLPLQPVRGQVTYVTADKLALSYPVMFGHYIAPLGAPMDNNAFSLGASFEQNNAGNEIKDSDDEKNIAAAKTMFPMLENVTVTAQWAGVRTASRDRFPIVGKVPGHDALYVSGALGSHGIQFSLLFGEILGCLLTGTPIPVSKDALKALSIERFYTKSG